MTLLHQTRSALLLETHSGSLDTDMRRGRDYNGGGSIRLKDKKILCFSGFTEGSGFIMNQIIFCVKSNPGSEYSIIPSSCVHPVLTSPPLGYLVQPYYPLRITISIIFVIISWISSIHEHDLISVISPQCYTLECDSRRSVHRSSWFLVSIHNVSRASVRAAAGAEPVAAELRKPYRRQRTAERPWRARRAGTQRAPQGLLQHVRVGVPGV